MVNFSFPTSNHFPSSSKLNFRRFAVKRSSISSYPYSKTIYYPYTPPPSKTDSHESNPTIAFSAISTRRWRLEKCTFKLTSRATVPMPSPCPLTHDLILPFHYRGGRMQWAEAQLPNWQTREEKKRLNQTKQKKSIIIRLAGWRKCDHFCWHLRTHSQHFTA